MQKTLLKKYWRIYDPEFCFGESKCYCEFLDRAIFNEYDIRAFYFDSVDDAVFAIKSLLKTNNKHLGKDRINNYFANNKLNEFIPKYEEIVFEEQNVSEDLCIIRVKIPVYKRVFPEEEVFDYDIIKEIVIKSINTTIMLFEKGDQQMFSNFKKEVL